MAPTEATRPDDPVETPSARTYEPRPVASPVQGHRSPGASEPGDMGAERAEERPPRDESGADGGKGYRGG